MIPINIEEITLSKGAHSSLEDGACVMELASYLAHQPWSDKPKCVSPVLGAFLRSWNDSLDSDTRQRLKPYAARVLNTAGDGKDEARAWMCVDWLVRVHAPAWLDLAKLGGHSQTLRGLPPIDSTVASRAAQGTLDAAWSAAWSAARSAAWSAAWSAAESAARSAAESAAWSAAWSAAESAAWSAAESVARSAARSAAESAAGSALQPTVLALQESAFKLLDRMLGA